MLYVIGSNHSATQAVWACPLFFLSHIVDRLIWRDSFATPTPGTATSDPAKAP